MVLKFGVAKPSGTAFWSCASVAPLAKPFWKAEAELATAAKTLLALPGATKPEPVVNDDTAGALVMKRSAMRAWYRSLKIPKPPRITVDLVTLQAMPVR